MAAAPRLSRASELDVVEELGLPVDGRGAVGEDATSASLSFRSWIAVPGSTATTLRRPSSNRSGGSPSSIVSVPSSTTKTSSCAPSTVAAAARARR